MAVQPPAPSTPVQPSAPEDNLWRDVLEEQAKKGNLNIQYVVRKYQETVSEGPLLRLIQDIQQRIDVYHNILEGLKRDGYSAEDIKTRYEGLGLVPTDHLPNPLGSRMAEHALAKLREYGTGLVKLMAGYAKEIKAELRISVNVKFNITVNFALALPSVGFGVQDVGDE
jgi:hypothetical protein